MQTDSRGQESSGASAVDMRIFGKDGDGYELTVRLENAGSLREWLGAASYAKLVPYLASEAAWHSFMNSTSSALLNLQMRVRALLFDKATGCVYEESGETIVPSSLNPSYLQLNGNAIYLSLDQDAEDFKRYQACTSRTPTTPIRHQPYSAKGQTSHGQHTQMASRRNLEDGHEVKDGISSSQQQRQSSQGGHGYNMTNLKQETSKPSLNKVKKIEAWDSSDATKRPLEMIGGTISKKLRSPKISTKATFQTEGAGFPVRDHQDKMASQKSAGGFARSLEEGSRVSTLPCSGRTGHAADSGDIGPLWYDKCAKINFNERMQRLAQRAAQQKLPFAEREGFSRTPEGMVAYIDFNAKRQKTMSVVKRESEAPGTLSGVHISKPCSEVDKVKVDPTFVPDLKFLADSIPDNPVPAKRRKLEKYDHYPLGPLDNLDELQLRSSKGREDIGRQDAQSNSEAVLLSGRYQVSGKEMNVVPDSRQLDQPGDKVREHGADHMLRQTVAKLVADAGFEGLKQSSLDLFVDILDSRFKKLSTGLRGLIDSYRRQCSQSEYLKMFIQISGSSMEDMVEEVKEGVQKQQQLEQQRLAQLELEQEQLQLQMRQREEEELQQQQKQREEEELRQQKKQREELQLQEQKQQQEEEKLAQNKLHQEEQPLKQRQADEKHSQQQQQSSQKQRVLDQQQSPRETDLQQQQKVRQTEKQSLQSPHFQQHQLHKRQSEHQQNQQQPTQKQRQPDHQQSQQQKQRQSEHQLTQQQQQQQSQYASHKKRPQQAQSPRQSQPAKPGGMRSPPVPSAVHSVLKQARKACSDTMEQHKQKADQVMGLVKQHPQKMSQMSTLTYAQKHGSVGSPTKGSMTKSPDPYLGPLNPRQTLPQQSSVDKSHKRSQPQTSNTGRNSTTTGRNPKKVEKERPLEGKTLGESRPVMGKKAMQMMSGGNSSPWHPSLPMVKSQTSPMLQHVKQQTSSLQP
ncbi:hypothetical protein R1flu_006445 [Riccia fluitans]|uniref:Uncharacterized protein n=1 Tax=Riccia fluitans TaxID=41844 RepID=A0ABD1YW14_9MARC